MAKTKVDKNKTEYRSGEIRNEGKKRSITGYAAVFNSRSGNLGGFTEIIKPGAFDEALEHSDVRALFNHENNMVLGRTSSGTLELSIDDKGLKYRFDAPKTSFGDDLLEMINRGDIKESSFQFTVDEDSWEEDEETGAWTRTIHKIKRLYDVAPVTFPAYDETDVAQRSLNEFKAKNSKKKRSKNELGNLNNYRLRLMNL